MARSNCRNCGAALDKPWNFYEHCHNCIIDGMAEGRRLKWVSGLIGMQWELRPGRQVAAHQAVATMRRLVSTTTKDEILRYPDFLGIEEPEYEALRRKALELGPIHVGDEELGRATKLKFHKVESFAQVQELCAIGPVLLLNHAGAGPVHFDKDLDGRILSRVQQAGLIVGWMDKYLGYTPEIFTYLKQNDWAFPGAFIFENGKMVKTTRLKIGFFESIPNRLNAFVEGFFTEYMHARVFRFTEVAKELQAKYEAIYGKALAPAECAVVKEWRSRFLKESGFYTFPDIPEKKLRNAKASYAPVSADEVIVGLQDSTAFGSAKAGLLATCTGVHWCSAGASGAGCVKFSDISAHDVRHESKSSPVVLGPQLAVSLVCSAEGLSKLASFLREAVLITSATGADNAESAPVTEPTPPESAPGFFVVQGGALAGSVGIGCDGGLFTALFPDGMKLPCHHDLCLATTVEDQDKMEFDLYQGDDPLSAANRHVAHVEIRGVPPGAAGKQLHIAIAAAEDGSLTAEAKDIDTNRELAVVVGDPIGGPVGAFLGDVVQKSQESRSEGFGEAEGAVQRIRRGDADAHDFVHPAGETETRTRCIQCGAPIRSATAEKHDGLCKPCWKKHSRRR